MGCFLSSTLDNLIVYLSSLKSRQRREYLGFSIGATAHYDLDTPFYFTPIRHSRLVSYGGVIVQNVEVAKAIAAIVDNYVDYIFVDSEKKIAPSNFGQNDVGNLEKALFSIVCNATLLSYKGNDITLRSTDSLLRTLYPNMTGSKVAIVGLGNLGTKIALSILETGNFVYLFGSDAIRTKRISNFLNDVKTRTTLSKSMVAESLTFAVQDSEVLVTTTHRKNVISIDQVQTMKTCNDRRTPILIDVGKGCFDNKVIDHGYDVHRVDIEGQLSSEFDNLIELLMRQMHPKRQMTLSGYQLVRKGIVGKPGELLVDNPANPKILFGICKEGGSLLAHGNDVEILRKKMNHGVL